VKKLELSYLSFLAKKHGGKLLSRSYKEVKKPLRWSCKKGHKWTASPNGLVYQNRWCPFCANNRKLSLKECQTYAKSKSGVCLSNVYQNRNQPLKWKCHRGHIWMSAYGWMKRQNSWCWKCYTKRMGASSLLPLKILQSIAKKKGGRLLRRILKRGKPTEVVLRCSNGHVWQTLLNNLRKGAWCKECSRGSAERCTRLAFETIFRDSFPRVRPKWLRYKKGRPLELDGLNDRLRLAFEHQGRQHYDPSPYYSKNLSAFRRRVTLDKFKASVCKKRGVRLITIPEVGSLLKLKDLPQYILDQCLKKKVVVPYALPKNFNFAKAFTWSNKTWLSKLKTIARQKGGVCLSDKWLGWDFKYIFKCRCSKTWRTVPRVILNGSWCKSCASKKFHETRRPLHSSNMLSRLTKYAEYRDGTFLSDSWNGWRSRYSFRCKNGHTWKTDPNSLLNSKTWCNKCAYKARVVSRLKIMKPRNLSLIRS